MKNYEKYADEIRKYKDKDFCKDFVKPYISYVPKLVYLHLESAKDYSPDRLHFSAKTAECVLEKDDRFRFYGLLPVPKQL